MIRLFRPALAVAMVVVFLAGFAMVVYARWTRPVADGDASLSKDRYDDALARYAEAEARFDRFAAAKQVFADDYRHVVANQLWSLHRLQRFDEILDKAQRAPE